MRTSIIQRVGVGAVAVLLLAACGSNGTTPGENGTTPTEGGGTDPVTIRFTWWGNDDRADRYEESLDLFRAEYSHITVQTSWQAFPDYWTQRNTEAAGRALPDVMQFDSAYLREYAEAGRLLDLADLVADGTIDLSNYEQSVIDGGLLDGAQVAIPTSTNTLGMFVNPTVIDQVGISFPDEGYTLEDLNVWIQQVSEAGVENEEGHKLYGMGDYTGTFWFFLQWLVQQGIEPFSDDGGLNFTQDHIVEYLSLTADLRAGEHVFPTSRGVALAPLGGFTVNEVAAETSWDNFLAGYVADSGVEEIEIVPIWSGPSGTSNFFRPSMHLSAGSNTEHPHEAGLLINFLLTDPRVGEIFGTSKGVPADSEQRAAVDAEEGSIDARVMAYEDAVALTDTAPAPIPVKGFGSIEEQWRQLSEEIGYGTITPEQFAEQWWAEAEMQVG